MCVSLCTCDLLGGARGGGNLSFGLWGLEFSGLGFRVWCAVLGFKAILCSLNA